MRKLGKRLLVITLTFILSFNVISSNYETSQVHASASVIGLAELIVGIASSMGVIVPVAGAVAGAALSKAATDSFVSYVTGIDSSEVDVYDRLAAGAVTSIGVTSAMVNDVKGWLETLGIDAKSGSVAEKTVTIASGDFTWIEADKFSLGIVYKSAENTMTYVVRGFSALEQGDSKTAKFSIAYAKENQSSTHKTPYLITDKKITFGWVTEGRYDIGGYTLPDAKNKFYEDYVLKGHLGSRVGQNMNNGEYHPEFTVGKYYVYRGRVLSALALNKDNYLCSHDLSVISEFETQEEIKTALGGDISSSVDLTIPSIGTYDDKNIADLTDGRTLSAADLKAITDALVNPYADYKNGDGTITQEDLQNAVTAAIAAALAAAGSKEEPDIPPIPDVDVSGILDWLDKIYKAITTFFATASSFVTTFPLQRWKEFLETFPSVTQQITNAIGDVFLTDKSILDTLITFPTAESLKDLITGVPVDLADLKDAVTIFPKAFQDAMTDVITDVFPAALIDALTDALPKSIVQGVATLPLSIVDALIPELEMTIPFTLQASLPKILMDALSGSITIPDIKVDFPAIEIPNYMDILAQILAAILSIPALLTLDVPLIKAAVDAATKDVALETGVEPILALFQDISFSDDYTYPVIAIKTPDILKSYYPEPEIILCDFEDYAEYCLWARNIFRVTLWLAFLYWAAKQLQVKYHIA